MAEPTPSSAPLKTAEPLGELGKQTIISTIRDVYVLGYNDARIEKHEFDCHTVGEDHGGALFARLNQLLSQCAPQAVAAQAHAAVVVPEITDAMVDAYLAEQRRTVEEADRFGRPNIGGLHTDTVREACRNGLQAALAATQVEVQAEPVAVLNGAPYDPTSAMLIAAREIDPALPVDVIRAIWWAMWRTAPQAQPADAMDATPAAPAADALLEALESMVDVCESSDFDGAPSDASMIKARAAIAAYRATPAAANAKPADALLLHALELACDHIDIDSLRISHCKDAAVIDAAMAAAQPCRYTLDQGLPLLQEGQENDYGTCTIDAAMAAAQEGGDAAKEA